MKKRKYITFKCECGKERTVREDYKIKECKDCVRKRVSQLHIQKIKIGDKFNKWTVINYCNEFQGHSILYLCKCECGRESKVTGSALRRGRSRSCKSCARKVPNCINGHDISVWGRTPTGSCRACVKHKSLLRNYGITLDEFLELYIIQDGKCCICKKPLRLGIEEEGCGKAGRIEVDHLHGTKLPKRQTVRGLLCGGRWAGCNRKLGRIDNKEWLKGALEYITNPPAYDFIKNKDENAKN